MNKQFKKLMAGVFLLLPLCLTATPVAAQTGLVYLPVDTCRVLDTRFIGGWPGVPVSALTAMDVYLSDRVSGEIALQGGNAAGCQFPADAQAFTVTITTSANESADSYGSLIPWHVDYPLWINPVEVLTGADNQLREYENVDQVGAEAYFLGFSSINTTSSTPLVANGTTVRVCDPLKTFGDPCDFDVRVFSQRENHFIIDVVGYFAPMIVSDLPGSTTSSSTTTTTTTAAPTTTTTAAPTTTTTAAATTTTTAPPTTTTTT